jgi:hypothetical protein
MPPIVRWASELPGTQPAADNMARVRAALRHFVTGGIIDNCKFMKRLQGRPADLFEIRVRDTSPQIRIFGAFYLKNELICTNWRPRPDLDFENAKRVAELRWYKLFSWRPRYRAHVFTEYVDENGVHHDWDCRP